MSERVAYWLFGFALASALTVTIGRGLVAERGVRVLPALCVITVLLGLCLGWAINGYLDYVRASAQRPM